MSHSESPSRRLNLCGAQVRTLRQMRGWSILQLKEVLEQHGLILDRTNIGRLELGHRSASDVELVILAHVFEVPLDQLIWGGVPPTKSQFQETMRAILL